MVKYEVTSDIVAEFIYNDTLKGLYVRLHTSENDYMEVTKCTEDEANTLVKQYKKLLKAIDNDKYAKAFHAIMDSVLIE